MTVSRHLLLLEFLLSGQLSGFNDKRSSQDDDRWTWTTFCIATLHHGKFSASKWLSPWHFTSPVGLMAPELNYRFVTVDWRLDYATQSRADSVYPVSVKEKPAPFGSTWFTRMNESAGKQTSPQLPETQNIKKNILVRHPLVVTVSSRTRKPRNGCKLIEQLYNENKSKWYQTLSFSEDVIPSEFKNARWL